MGVAATVLVEEVVVVVVRCFRPVIPLSAVMLVNVWSVWKWSTVVACCGICFEFPLLVVCVSASVDMHVCECSGTSLLVLIQL